jgi:hypothetical protein
MARKKPGKRKSRKKKAGGRKTIARAKKTVRRKKRARSKAPGQVSPAEIHQGVGFPSAGPAEIAPELSGDASKV